MLAVVAYDIATAACGGERRLRKVERICRKWGTPVQNSVYECLLDAGQLLELKDALTRTIDPGHDSVRFYLLGNHYLSRVELIGLDRVAWDRQAGIIA